MSNTGFTKGIWKASVYDGNFKRAVVYTPKGGFDISGLPDCISNASLIACAPEMYELLENLHVQLDFIGDDKYKDSIEKLLSRARGEMESDND
jgi:hypothetical protein